jgi:hypothetical protein
MEKGNSHATLTKKNNKEVKYTEHNASEKRGKYTEHTTCEVTQVSCTGTN